MTVKSRALKAVNLSQGFPDDDPPVEVQRLLHEASAVSGAHQYSDPRGASVLRQAIAQKLKTFNQIDADPDRNVVVTCGATEALMVTFRSLFEPGDEIITFAPTYENYFLQTRTAGVRLTTVSLREPSFAISADDLASALSPRTRAILICNPCNPTGKVFSLDELRMLSDFAGRNNLLIISDETYERFIWRGAHVSIASLPEAKGRVVSIFSMGKTYSVTGWRIGYVVIPDACANHVAAQHDLTTVAASHPCQLALAQALQLPESFYAETLQRYERRKKALMEALNAVGLVPWNPAGSYFLWCDYTSLTNEPDTEFADRVLQQAGVAGVPGAVFYPAGAENPRRIRFTFSKSLSTIEEAAERLVASRDLLFTTTTRRLSCGY